MFSFLSQEAVDLPLTQDKEIYATDGTRVLRSSEEANVACLVPCLQEEAETRLLVHVADVVQMGCKKVTIRTVNTDVVVQAIGSIIKIDPVELWVAFGVGLSFRYKAIHEIVATMAPAMCMTVPVFHAFTGCDTASAFAARGKATVWET